MSGIDVERIRAETPGCGEVVHLNNAGAALPPRSVLTACIDYLEAEARIGGYEVAASRAASVERVYTAGARLLGCRADELAFTTSATEAWHKALQVIPLAEGDRVLATASEYVSNAYGLIGLRNRGVEVKLVPDDETGATSLAALEDLLDERVKLVCATHIPTGGGIVNPAADIGRLAKAAGAWYLLDACQSAGQLPLDVDELQCDFLALTGRKFLRGPRGTGLLYARNGAEGLGDPVTMDGWSADWVDDWAYEPGPGARRFETFEVSMAAKVGLGVAIEYALDVGLAPIAKRIEDLGARFRAMLAETPLVRLVQADGPQSGIVTFDVDGRDSDAVAAALRAWGVNVSVTHPLPSAFNGGGRHAGKLIRASVHYYNNEDDLIDAIAAL